MTLDVADVFLGATHVGELKCQRGPDAIEFTLNPDYLDDPEHPVLGQAYETGHPKRLDVRSSLRVPTWFGHLLPSGRLRTLLASHAGVNPQREFYLLTALGSNLAGAVRVVSRNELNGAAPLPPDVPKPDRLRSMRFSLAGMQLKFSADETTKGMTIPTASTQADGGRFIVKLPGSHANLAENELVVMAWARACGIDVPDHRLVDVDDIEGLPERPSPGKALAVRRFDRNGHAVHQEDFAQVFSKDHDPDRNAHYEGDLERVASFVLVRCGIADLRELVRRAVFSVLAGNSDAHLKNWSLRYPDGVHPRLSPAYDLVFVGAYDGYIRSLALKVGGEDQFERVDRSTFATFAHRVTAKARSLGCAESPTVDEIAGWIRDDASRVRATWLTLPERDLLPEAMCELLESHMGRSRLK